MGGRMQSVSEKELTLLHGRLDAIDGTGKFNYDMRGAVFACKPHHDVVSDLKEAIFIGRRKGIDARTQLKDPTTTNVVVTTIFDVMAVAKIGPTSGITIERLLADIVRAVELKDDPFLRDPETGRNLVSQPICVVDAEGELGDAWADFELAVVGIRCVHPHVYGEPDVVT
jgi:hypothetical protein